MAPLLQSATTPTDGSAIVTVRGDLDTDTAAQLWQYLSYLIGQGHHHIVLDLRGMILIDSAGVDVITRASAWTRRKGWRAGAAVGQPGPGRAVGAGPPRPGPPAPSLSSRQLTPPRPGNHDREDQVPDDWQLPPGLLQQLTLAVLDHAADNGQRTIKAIPLLARPWESFGPVSEVGGGPLEDGSDDRLVIGRL